MLFALRINSRKLVLGESIRSNSAESQLNSSKLNYKRSPASLGSRGIIYIYV